MARRFPWILLAALAGVAGAGCARTETGAPRALARPGAMVLIPAGKFTMGDAGSRPDEAPPHTVTVSAFYLDAYPVTQELYEEVMGANPSKHKGKNNPVERTQWTDAVRFCNRASERDGLTPCYNLETWECNFEADGYRLPTEAEWEHACRAGSTGAYSFGDDPAELPRYAWFRPHSQGKPRPLGQKPPNAWGLYEMHGNVWQWCNDWYAADYYSASPADNPRGPANGTMRILRGGAWDCTAEKLRSAYRHKEFPVYSDACFGADSYGFRRARKASTQPGAEASEVAADRSRGQQPLSPRERVPEGRVRAAAQPSAVASERVAEGQVNAPIDLTRLKGTIVFASDRGGTMKIWRMHASGTGARPLTRGSDPDADPRFAPDGRRILYTTLRGGFPEVWVMNRDGSDPRFVTQGSQGSWAPDGKSIVFIRDNQAFVRDLAGGRGQDQERRVTPPEWERCGVPAFAPDGKQIAVASRHLGEIGIFLVSLDGREKHALKTGEACCTPAWSPDGTKLLCQTVQGHIHQVDRDGANWEQLTYGADVQHDARYAPDGAFILFCRAPAPEGPWQICVKRIDGDPDEFVPLTQEGSNLLPDWHALED
jgi:formylglycine-generating enzyme required for sulfatase activity